MRTYLALLAFSAVAAFAVACYNPSVKNGAFSCSMDLGNACPGGFVCSGGLCIHPQAQDMAMVPLDLAGDQAVVPFVPTCDDFVSAGKFQNLSPLTTLNTASDEIHLSLDSGSANWRLLYQSGGTLYASALSGSTHNMAAAPVAVTLTGGPTTTSGGSFTTDGKFWFSGTLAGVTNLYSATSTGPATFNVAAAILPMTGPPTTIGTCGFSDPAFYKNTAANDMSVGLEMYATYPLAGCTGPSYAVLGAEGRNIGGFVSALPNSGWASTSLTPTGNGLIVSSQASPRSLSIALRSGFGFQFNGSQPIPMDAIGASTEDYQAVVSNDCTEIYFSSVRTGGKGGADIYVADIVKE
jgi:hypothetical protein